MSHYPSGSEPDFGGSECFARDRRPWHSQCPFHRWWHTAPVPFWGQRGNARRIPDNHHPPSVSCKCTLRRGRGDGGSEFRHCPLPQRGWESYRTPADQILSQRIWETWGGWKSDPYYSQMCPSTQQCRCFPVAQNNCYPINIIEEECICLFCCWIIYILNHMLIFTMWQRFWSWIGLESLRAAPTGCRDNPHPHYTLRPVRLFQLLWSFSVASDH